MGPHGLGGLGGIEEFSSEMGACLAGKANQGVSLGGFCVYLKVSKKHPLEGLGMFLFLSCFPVFPMVFEFFPWFLRRFRGFSSSVWTSWALTSRFLVGKTKAKEVKGSPLRGLGRAL